MSTLSGIATAAKTKAYAAISPNSALSIRSSLSADSVTKYVSMIERAAAWPSEAEAEAMIKGLAAPRESTCRAIARRVYTALHASSVAMNAQRPAPITRATCHIG